MSLYAVKTTASQEQTVAEMIAEKEMPNIHAALSEDSMVGYVLVESDDAGEVERVIEEIPHAQKMLQGQSSMAEIDHLLQPTSAVENVHEGDVVEMTGGPYSGEKAVVQRVDESQEQVTVELSEATVPIPVTMRGDKIRVLDSDER